MSDIVNRVNQNTKLTNMENIKIIKASTEDICRIMEIVNRHSELNSRISSGKYLLFGHQHDKIIFDPKSLDVIFLIFGLFSTCKKEVNFQKCGTHISSI